MNPVSRRHFLQTSLLTVGGTLSCGSFLKLRGETFNPGQLRPAQMLLDMVHNNPGETPFVTHYNDPGFLKDLGYKSKVYELFEGAQFAIDWSSVDPDIFPVGSPSRSWVNQKAFDLDKMYSATKAAGLEVYCHTDMVVFPKQLVEKYHLTDFKNVSAPDTQKYLRLAISQMFSRFPQLDGLVIRIGETYLQGAPFHEGGINDKTDPQKTIIPLMELLREEVCEKLGKKILFRSWVSFDTSLEKYTMVSNGVEPHPNLYISVKHCEGDFHRGNLFSRILGTGRHQQVIEVQCQREYEGKGAYPNYIAHGVIEGFEEHAGQSIRGVWSNPLISGMFTWSRGGGWKGPYITNEIWCDLNAYVLSKWAQEPNRTEESVFDDFCTIILKLSAPDTASFRKLCLLSADAVYRGIRSTKNDISPWWTRDQYMDRPPLPKSPVAIKHLLDEKDQAVEMWTEIVSLAISIQFKDAATAEYVVTSCQYGLDVYHIYRDGFQLAALSQSKDKSQLGTLIKDYDETWAEYKKLPVEHPSCATLYTDMAFGNKPGLGAMVDELRKMAVPN